ncbi:hypothetical protein EPA93_16220 [Ktedonosporobacter rubrisoli]|uniref:Uncharacterized protein n=1 Tax=Ktedonosporobacter rubrisoli TaxID=2509675 RepID=A0A4P6JQC1_KTERU|nr:hypothetical protein [Ktedonosporobacter rubrisoli]QBD77453.1 hypothetical protein EPA93_16220 [Ktedonosporobacter rubrisoli]
MSQVLSTYGWFQMLIPHEHRGEDANQQKAVSGVIEAAHREFVEIGQASGIDPLLIRNARFHY